MGLAITEHSYQWIPSEGASCGHESQYTDLLQPASTSVSRCTPTPSKMSWNSYIDNLLASGQVKKAAICGHDGSKWAASEGFNVTQEEAKNLMAAFTNYSHLTTSGMYVGGERYIFLSGSDQVLRGKKGTSGIHVGKTGQAILIGFYDEPTTPNQCATQVETMADYLKGLNY